MGWSNVIATLYSVFMVCRIIHNVGISYLQNQIWGYFDIAYIVINSIINIGLIGNDVFDDETLRIIESLMAIIIVIKCLYFMQLVDEISPFINTIWIIMAEIKWFMLVLMIFIVGFSTSFWLIG